MNEDWPPGPRHPALAGDEVHVWLAHLDSSVWPGPAGLPLAERERAARFLRLEAGRRWVASRWVLRKVLARYLDEAPEAIALVTEEHGKPRLADSSSKLRFNVSHSGALALLAVCEGREVGVDVEEIEPAHDLLALAERALPPDAAASVAAAAPADRALVFHQAWARHEARLKCLGIGLAFDRFHPSPPDSEDKGGNDRDQGEPVAVVDLEVPPGYAGAVAVTGELRTLRCWSHPASAA
ncbi:MAG: 4'-phosphopantetheinyl transferase family protein [Solirubrobacterales bacterium]